MATPTYTPIASITLGSSASSVTFSSIPQGYRDLVLVIVAGPSNAAFGGIRYNADSGTNYSYVVARGDGSSAVSASSGSLDYAPIGVSVANAGTNSITQIMDYSATDKHKTALNRANDSTQSSEMISARWANTNAITSIEFFCFGAGSMVSGSTFALWGIAS